jgi:hypothetical protein
MLHQYRRFVQHRKALDEFIASEGRKPKGFCDSCAYIWCQNNVTPTRALPVDGDDKEIKTYICDDKKDDPLIPADVR